MWTEKTVESCKQEIKSELDQAEAQHGLEHREKLIQDRIAELESSTSESDLLTLYIYLVSSLVLHVRIQNLSAKVIKKTIHLATSILQAQGIKENTSRLSFLHGELHSIWSQIEWQNGHHWQAAWQQFLGYQVTRDAHSKVHHFQQLTMSNRALRLGHIETALEGYFKAQDHLSGELADQCYVNTIKSLRLSDQQKEAQDKISSLQALELSPSLRNELAWENHVYAYLDKQDLSPMLKSIKKGEPHHQTSYIIEACLWSMIPPSKSWMQKTPSLENLKRKKELRPEKGDIFYLAAKTINDCYDSDIPLHRRLNSLGEILAQQHLQINIDKELLIWAAAYRWLIRSRNQTLLSLIEKEYASLCLKLSSGVNHDLLHISRSSD